MKVGVVGLGKLGFPLALGFAIKGHEVIGYDVDYGRMNRTWFKEIEAGIEGKTFDALLSEADNLRFEPMEVLVKEAEIIFVVVQTNCEAGYDGTNRMPRDRKDYDLKPLEGAVRQIVNAAGKVADWKRKPLVINSTLLPGTADTFEVEIGKHFDLLTNPQFCAMGNVLSDMVSPEWVIIGAQDHEQAMPLADFYATITDSPIIVVSRIESEIIKTCYNGWITTKINYANAVMELCQRVGGDADTVMTVLGKATRRLVSTMYWKGGMGDGGGCLVGGQYVYTIDGMKKIEDVEQGDMVLNGKGAYSQVESISARDYDGGVSRLFPRGLPAIELTDEHPVLVADDLRKKYTWREKTMHDGRHPVNDAIGEPYYLPASEVNTDHYVLFPMPVSGSRQKDETYEVLAGYYLSEGTVEWRQDRGCYGRVAFHFHERELEYQENVCNLVAALSLKGVVKHTKNHCAVLRVHDPKLAARLDNDFGHGASTKVLPAWVLDGSQGTAENILRGMFRGDGSSHRYGYTFSTTSRDLAFGAHLLLKRLRIPSRIKEHGARFNGCDHRRSWDVVVSNARDLQRMSAIVGMPLKHKMQAKRYEHVFERGGQFYHKVRKVERFATKQKVYNLEMREAEPSFVTVAGTVHNCHPKENMALSYLARSIGLSFDWFGMNMECREAETEWLATLLEDAAQAMNKSEVWLIGMAFKAGVTQLHGSAAVLLKNILEDRGLVKVRVHDPIIGMGEELPSDAIVGLISCNHTLFTTYQWHKGSMILDPWRYLAECDEVLPIGRV